MQLKDMIGYAELNEAFRHFKEFGNTIVFLNLLESALVCHPQELSLLLWLDKPLLVMSQCLVENQQFVQTAPLLGINTKNMHDKPDEQDPTASSTVYITAASIIGHLEANPHIAKAPHILKGMRNLGTAYAPMWQDGLTLLSSRSVGAHVEGGQAVQAALRASLPLQGRPRAHRRDGGQG
jgi:hypothetical protein